LVLVQAEPLKLFNAKFVESTKLEKDYKLAEPQQEVL
jgi:hypothetical protein